jgi:hypothetical protein
LQLARHGADVVAAAATDSITQPANPKWNDDNPEKNGNSISMVIMMRMTNLRLLKSLSFMKPTE